MNLVKVDNTAKTECKPCDKNDFLCQSAAGAVASKPSNERSAVPDGLALFQPMNGGETIDIKSEKTDTRTEENIADKNKLEQIQGWSESERNLAMATLAALIVLVISSHRWYPLCCKNADLLFAGAHYIVDTVSLLISK